MESTSCVNHTALRDLSTIDRPSENALFTQNRKFRNLLHKFFFNVLSTKTHYKIAQTGKIC